MSEPIKRLEIETYYQNGIGVTVRIDYVNGTISLIDEKNEPKKWVFAHRGIDYMQGWVYIFDAMIHAVARAEQKLLKHQKAVKRDLDLKVADLKKEVDKEAKKKT